MKFGRKSTPAPEEAVTPVEAEPDAASATGPFDAEDVPDDGVSRVDLGSMLVAPVPGSELRLQVDERTQQVQSVLLAATEGALELRAFAAPRNGDLWSQIRPQLAADMARRGGTATEREGRFGPELVCRLTVQTPDGRTGQQDLPDRRHQRLALAAAGDVPGQARRRRRDRRLLGGRADPGRRTPGRPRDARR